MPKVQRSLLVVLLSMKLYTFSKVHIIEAESPSIGSIGKLDDERKMHTEGSFPFFRSGAVPHGQKCLGKLNDGRDTYKGENYHCSEVDTCMDTLDDGKETFRREYSKCSKVDQHPMDRNALVYWMMK